MFLKLRHQHYYALSWLFHSAQKDTAMHKTRSITESDS
jgi:hypothetical protein